MAWLFVTGGVRRGGDGRAAEDAAAMTDSVIYRGRAFKDLMVGGRFADSMTVTQARVVLAAGPFKISTPPTPMPHGRPATAWAAGWLDLEASVAEGSLARRLPGGFGDTPYRTRTLRGKG